MLTPEQKKNNLRLGLILGSIALIFFVGFMVRLVFFGAAKPPARMTGSAAISSPAAVPAPVSTGAATTATAR
jgi:hypothetical protein